ncbi:hypothetical protein E8D66_13205 [Escherichia coli]|nr:hypothetical protein [Escherichia coli]
MLETVCLRYSPKGRQRKAPPDYKSKFVLTPKSWTVKHEAYRSDSDIQLESDLLISGWICPYISRHLLSLNPLQARCRRYSRGER